MSAIIVKTTNDHSIFKTLAGNREIKKITVEKIKRSIKKVGYITNPIIVNELYEIIDGQNRQQALEKLHMPVDFIVVDGAGLEECRAMNINQSTWAVKDYIYSYASQGDSSYIRLQHLIDRFSKRGVDYRVIGAVLNKGLGEIANATIIKGGLLLGEQEYRNAISCCEYLTQFVKPLKDAKIGTIRAYLDVLAYVYYNKEIDNNEMLQKIAKRKTMLSPAVNVEQASEVLSEIYDYKKSIKLYFHSSYKKETDAFARTRNGITRKGSKDGE